jgi:hypothetical protein
MTMYATGTDFAIPTGRDEAKLAVYFPSMDYIDYIREDGIKISERIDEYLSVLRNEFGDVVGFKLKGFKNYFIKKLKPAFSLEDADFVWISDLLVALVQEEGAKIFADDQRKVHRLSAYRQVSKIAREDKVVCSKLEIEAIAA